MSWGIKKNEFAAIQTPPPLTEEKSAEGFIGTALFYGFGDTGSDHSDAVLSGKLAWEYAKKSWWRKTWQCEYIDFERADHFRVRPGAPHRPKGFYHAMITIGEKFQKLTVSQVRKKFRDSPVSGWASEGIQFVAITHKHVQGLMNERKIPLLTFADYDVAPYGFNDFFDSAQMFCSNHILGLGIGNVDFNYPLFGIPILILVKQEIISA